MLCRIGMRDRESGWYYRCLKLYTERQAEDLADRMRKKYPRFEYRVIPATQPWKKGVEERVVGGNGRETLRQGE